MADILDRWHSRGHIDESEYEAGVRLRRTFDLIVKGGLDSRAVPPDVAATGMSAFRRLMPLLGEDRKHLSVAVICRGFTSEDALRAYGNLGVRTEEEVRFMVRRSLLGMHRHRWGTVRETPVADIPELISIRTEHGVSSVTLKA